MHDCQVYYGPGCWDSLHLMSAKAHNNNSRKDAVVYLVDIFCTDFCCKKCQKHFREFRREHPIEDYINKEDGLFKWCWKAHNNANRLTGKPLFSYERAVLKYKVR